MTILIFIAVLVVLVFVHEFGHFVTAKLLGMKVEEFGFGFPPRIAGFKKGETLYSLNLLPLGGFVRILGEEGEGAKDPRSYASRPVWQRALVLLTGVFMNLVLAFFLFWITFTIGFPSALSGEVSDGQVIGKSVQIINVAPESPAQNAKIEIGDIVQKIQYAKTGEEIIVQSVRDMQEFTLSHKGEILTIVMKRGGNIVQASLLARESPPEGQGALGLQLADVGLIKYPWHKAFYRALISVSKNFVLIPYSIGVLLKQLLFQGNVAGEVAGPVGIAVMVGKFYGLGIHYFLAFVGFISINLAALNILPIPALDGGRFLFVIIEKVKGSPVKPSLENKIHAVGFALLLTLILLITIHDILKL